MVHATSDAARQHRLQELSQFLRSRRAKLSPGELGLDLSRRRRTPGLRREEVAVLAGVGTSWYTWLEQGRDINVSTEVVQAISRALRLSPAEEAYFFRLTGLNHPSQPATAPAVQEKSYLDQIVTQWFPQPALAVDPFFNILAANDAVPEVLGFPAGGNVLVTFFTDRSCRDRYRDSDHLAQVTVSHFRADMAHYFGDPRLERLTSHLCALSPEFTRLWESHNVLDVDQHRAKVVRHRKATELTFHVHTWNLAANDNVKLILHTPTDQATRESLYRLFPEQPVQAEGGDAPES
ncbi:helix-turn-helix transcriptional regulator [Kitasatospora sp. NPDC049258]|uniref:helix-turn-helix transcriptional regulator n=1 Tax=Kitasatospora sp. NPDC049258 TaxID=3155394 RepID=UPI0034233B4F